MCMYVCVCMHVYVDTCVAFEAEAAYQYEGLVFKGLVCVYACVCIYMSLKQERCIGMKGLC